MYDYAYLTVKLDQNAAKRCSDSFLDFRIFFIWRLSKTTVTIGTIFSSNTVAGICPNPLGAAIAIRATLKPASEGVWIRERKGWEVEKERKGRAKRRNGKEDGREVLLIYNLTAVSVCLPFSNSSKNHLSLQPVSELAKHYKRGHHSVVVTWYHRQDGRHRNT